ncbi:MAG: hypothetical protein ACLUR9_06010 [Christensenellales bacterium]
MKHFDLQLFAVDAKTVKAADLAKVRDVDFIERFTTDLGTLMKMLGVTRKIEKKAGETLKVYKVTGTLESGTVAEGEVIPLSKYKTTYTAVGEAELKKWRKVTTAEAISEKGYGQAVNDTNAKMLKDIQKGIRSQFVTFLGTGTGAAAGVGVQAAMAQVWGQLQVLFEDTSIETVYFMNPLDVADYLGSAQISTQTAFGMSYIENFLGMGSAILASDVPKGKIYATAAENIVLYYIPVTSADMAQAFDLTADATGLIGIHTGATYDNLSAETVAASGVGLFAEKLDGIVVGTINGATDSGLDNLSVTSVAGTASGDTKVTVSPALTAGNSYKYKVADNAVLPAVGQNVRTWSSWDGTSDITAATGKEIVVVECDAAYRAVKGGVATVTAKA